MIKGGVSSEETPNSPPPSPYLLILPRHESFEYGLLPIPILIFNDGTPTSSSKENRNKSSCHHNNKINPSNKRFSFLTNLSLIALPISPHFLSPLSLQRRWAQMRPSCRLTTGLATDVDGSEKSEKKEKYFPGPLPIVKLTHTFDWADDERDTGLSLPERGRYRGPDVDAPSRELYKDDRDAVGSWRAMPQPRDERASMKPFGVGREVNRDSGSSSGE